MQKGFYFDQSRCIGCYTCLIACKDWHEYEMGSEPENWMRVIITERGKFPDVFSAYLAQPCLHCEDPPCVTACPVGVIEKRSKDGIVVVDRDACLGNGACECNCRAACPYDSPKFGPETDAKMQKCELCHDRWIQGKKPVCVEACPMRALDAGPLDELKTLYGDVREADGFIYSEEAKPSVVFKQKSKTSA